MPQTFQADQSARYTITVQGCVPADWVDYLGGLTVTTNTKTTQPITTLSGTMTDQAALMGVLNNLYNLGFSILSVEYQSESNKEKQHVR